jgi:phage shock protein E
MRRISRALAIPMFLAVGLGCAAQTVSQDLTVYLEPESLLDLMQDLPESVFLVDVRTPAEYEAGHIPGAINVDHTAIAGNLPTDDREATIIVYCRSGNRSSQAAHVLQELGFTRVLDCGGITNWPYDLVVGSEPQ